MKSKTEIVHAGGISHLIRSIRDQRVLLDSDLAALYAVPTKRLNEQYRRNLNRFPQDFAFQLTAAEWDVSRSQIATFEGPENLRSLNATSSSHGGRRHPPVAFTEHGALMAANILNSRRAVAMSVYVIRAFVKLREDLSVGSSRNSPRSRWRALSPNRLVCVERLALIPALHFYSAN